MTALTLCCQMLADDAAQHAHDLAVARLMLAEALAQLHANTLTIAALRARLQAVKEENRVQREAMCRPSP